MPIIDIVATGLNIKEMLKEKGLTIKDIQKAFGFASVYPVYKWINGKNLPAIENLVILAKMMDTTIDDILVIEMK